MRNLRWVAIISCWLLASGQASPWATFDNTTDPQDMFLSTPLWRLSVRKSDCTITSLTHTPTGLLLFTGFPGGSWVLYNSTANIPSSRPAHTEYTWMEAESTLAMTWYPLETDGSMPSVVVIVAAPSGQRWLDLSFQLLSSQTGPGITYDSISWPMLNYNTTGLQGIFYPQLPGLLLNSTWWSSLPGSTGQSIPYPGSGTYADMTWWNLTAQDGTPVSVSHMAVAPADCTIPTYLGFYPSSSLGPGMWRYRHDYPGVNLTTGCSVQNYGPAPCAVGFHGAMKARIAIGGSIMDDTLLYGTSNGLIGNGSQAMGDGSPTPAPLPHLSTKLPLDLLQKLARAPLYKLDAVECGMNFTDYKAQVYPLLPEPGLVHFVAFEPVAFDHWFPDYLPPNPKYGTGCDLAQAFQDALDAGHLTMPYSNPTWWDPAAPTLAHLPPGLTLTDVTTLNASLQTVYETYPDVPPSTGVVTELRHPFVYSRWVQLMCQMSFNASGCGSAVPLKHVASAKACDESTVRLPSSLIFEDQMGARHAYADYHPLAAGMSALAYQGAIEEHVQNFSNVGLGTEQGYDKIARYVAAFFGNNLEVANSEAGNGGAWPWGLNSSWTPYPVSQSLFGPSVLYQVHDLETQAFARTLGNACWILASGGRLSIDAANVRYWSESDAAWYRSVALLQRVVVSQYTAYGQTEYTALGGQEVTVGTGATRTTMLAVAGQQPLFPTASSSYTIFTNWAFEDSLTLRVPVSPAPGQDALTFTLPPTGCAIYGAQGDTSGGWFTAYNNQSLTASAMGYHSIIEDRSCTAASSRAGHGGHGGIMGQPAVCVWHALGPDTDLSIQIPVGCTGASTSVVAVGADGSVLGPIPSTFVPALGTLSFHAEATIGTGQRVDHFQLSC